MCGDLSLCFCFCSCLSLHAAVGKRGDVASLCVFRSLCRVRSSHSTLNGVVGNAIAFRSLWQLLFFFVFCFLAVFLLVTKSLFSHNFKSFSFHFALRCYTEAPFPLWGPPTCAALALEYARAQVRYVWFVLVCGSVTASILLCSRAYFSVLCLVPPPSTTFLFFHSTSRPFFVVLPLPHTAKSTIVLQGTQFTPIVWIFFGCLFSVWICLLQPLLSLLSVLFVTLFICFRTVTLMWSCLLTFPFLVCFSPFFAGSLWCAFFSSCSSQASAFLPACFSCAAVLILQCCVRVFLFFFVLLLIISRLPPLVLRTHAHLRSTLVFSVPLPLVLFCCLALPTIFFFLAAVTPPLSPSAKRRPKVARSSLVFSLFFSLCHALSFHLLSNSFSDSPSFVLKGPPTSKLRDSLSDDCI